MFNRDEVGITPPTIKETILASLGYNILMRIILTHEQADFDALASLLGAHLLDDEAWPILPRKMNRNVRAFMTIYGAELPFIEARDLPSGPIDSVFLVDTQSMISVRGVGANIKVQVIDHHPKREDIPVDWVVTESRVGATTTLLVETLREENGHISMIHATLLLLGIYEDTGSLTYSRTTARDLQAASFLLEQGANLQIAADFLNHPLSIDQQHLYDKLRQNAETHKVHGHTIILAKATAKEMEEELSTVAHKLRDLLEPDGLFVLVTTRSGVQLIARSTTDHIDVAEIASYFGGGGHDRAAAALIHNRTLSNVYRELVRILPIYVRPAVTVAQIMSRDPQVLSPDTLADEAIQRMQRYGYEGYPVVKDGHVVGLLTRREVDRTLAHKLNKSAESLMNAGCVTVNPDDSIEHLQRLMTDTGWGQIPVLQPDTGEIIGIVTRTDLLKTFTAQARIPGNQNLAARLESVLPPARLALLKTVARIAHEQRLAIYIVGGFVRDLLLNRPGVDYDIVVEGDAILLARALAGKFDGRVTSHARFGTAKWYLSDQLVLADGEIAICDSPKQPIDRAIPEFPGFLDLISARTEFYTYPTALPTVERGSIKLDLHRRDFTINTLALRLDGHHYGELYDYWGGLNDLHQGLVRVLHSLSFVDDPTRMLRAVRFEQRFNFRIEARTMQLLREALSILGRVSGDRIHHELDHILDEDRAQAMIARLDELDLLKSIHPALRWDSWLESRFTALPSEPPVDEWGYGILPSGRKTSWRAHRRTLAYILWLIRLPTDQILSVIERIKHPRSNTKVILEAARLWQELPALRDLKPSQVVARLDDIPHQAIYAACLAEEDAHLCRILRTYLTRWHKVKPTITGDRIKAQGLQPGPIYKQILETLRAAWLDEVVETPDQEEKLFNKLLDEAIKSQSYG